MADTVEGLVKRDIYEVANQLQGYVGPSTDEKLAAWLMREGDEAAKLADEIVRLRAQVEALVVERDEARGKVARQATEIQRMARKIKNQRGMARMTWDIVESRAHWTRGILNRNKYLDMTMVASRERRAAEARALAAEAQRDKAIEALKPCINVLQMLTDAKISPNTSMAAVWAQCVEAETRARSTLNEIAP